jgi:hypothetical protein
MRAVMTSFQTATVTLVLVSLIAGIPWSPDARGQSGASALGAAGTVWGGQHVGLQVTSDGAMLEFDCASGTITKPIQLDAQGNFKITGTYTREHPGPVMRDGNPAAAATYSGSIHNGTMKLSITSGTQSDSQGEYALVQGKAGRVVKCK